MSLPELETNTGVALSPPQGHTLAELDEALAALQGGGVAVLPTDTLYGLSADAGNTLALERIFDIKGRPASLALPLLVANRQQVGLVATGFDAHRQALAAAFWPGSLTLVLPRTPGLSTLITGERDTVAVRMPGHWAPLNLAHWLGRPITGTSANRSGQANLLSIREIRETLGNDVDAVVDVGPEPQGLQSTIIDVTGPRPALLREGATPFSEIMRVWESIGKSGTVQPDSGV